MTGKAIVFEPRHVGHTIGFAAEFATALAAAGYETRLCLNAAAQGRAELAEAMSGETPFDIEWIEPFEAVFTSAEQGTREAGIIAHLNRRHAPDRLAIPTADALAAAASTNRDVRMVLANLPRMDLVLHHLAAAYPPRGRATLRRWRRGLAELAALRGHRVLTCDAYVGLGPGGWFARASGVRPKHLPHLLQKRTQRSRQQIREAFGLASEATVLVSIGDVAHRKGIDRLIAAATRTDWPADIVLFLAGPVSSHLRPELDRALKDWPGRFHVIDRFLSNEEFVAAFVAADLVWAVTPTNLGVSSTFLYAALHGRPAIVARAHRSARWMCGRIGPGVPTTLDPGAISAAVELACSLPPQTEIQVRFLDRIISASDYDRIVANDAA